MVMSPQVSWLFFEARAKRPYLGSYRSSELRVSTFGTSPTIAFELGRKPVCEMLGGMERRHVQYFRYEKRCGVPFACGGEKAGVEQVTRESLIAYPHAGLMML